MAIIQKYLVYDMTTTALFNSWCSGISTAMAQMGLTQTNDTGQVVWTSSVVSVTAATKSGNNVTYTYTLTSGPVLRIGMSLVIISMTNGGNNGTFTITALGSGTFTVVNASGVTESGSSGSGSTTANASVGATRFAGIYNCYEIWQFSDPLSATCPIIIKLAYGTASINNNSSTNASGDWASSIYMQVGTKSDGAGNILGNTFGPFYSIICWPSGASNWYYPTNNTGNAFWECNFSYDGGRIAMMLWRNFVGTGATAPCCFCIERSRDQYGNYTDSYFTVLGAGTYVGANSGGGVGQRMYIQNSQGSIFPSGRGSVYSNGLGTTGITEYTYWASITQPNAATITGNSFAVLPVFPTVGKLDNPLTSFVVVKSGDQTEGALFNASIYGSTHPYLYSKALAFTSVLPWANSGVAIRWD